LERERSRKTFGFISVACERERRIANPPYHILDRRRRKRRVGIAGKGFLKEMFTP
jgi:hypothetical protein